MEPLTILALVAAGAIAYKATRPAAAASSQGTAAAQDTTPTSEEGVGAVLGSGGLGAALGGLAIGAVVGEFERQAAERTYRDESARVIGKMNYVLTELSVSNAFDPLLIAGNTNRDILGKFAAELGPIPKVWAYEPGKRADGSYKQDPVQFYGQGVGYVCGTIFNERNEVVRLQVSTWLYQYLDARRKYLKDEAAYERALAEREDAIYEEPNAEPPPLPEPPAPPVMPPPPPPPGTIVSIPGFPGVKGRIE